jgi:hypothetical protein
MRLRHRPTRPHSGVQRHLNPPYGANRRHGGRLHIRAEGSENKPRSDRPKRRDSGGGTTAGGTTPGMTPAQLEMLQQSQEMNQAGPGSMPYNPTAGGSKRGGRVGIKRRADGGGVDDVGRKSGGRWIAGAIKHRGGLHRALHVPEGEKIPAKKLAKASHSENPRIRRMVGLAKTLKKMH